MKKDKRMNMTLGLKQASLLLAISAPAYLTASKASSQVIWEPGMTAIDDSGSKECVQKSSGAWNGCKSLPRGPTAEHKITFEAEKPSPTVNAYISTMAFQNLLTYSYDCGGAYNPTRIAVGDWKQAIVFAPSGSLTFTFSSIAMGLYSLERDSSTFSTISSNCKLVILGNDSYPVSLEGLRLYTSLQVSALNAYTEVIKAISKTGDISAVVDSIDTAIGIFNDQLDKIKTAIEDAKLDMDLETDTVKKQNLQTLVAGYEADLLTRTAALEALTASASKVQVTCSGEECASSLSEVQKLVQLNSDAFRKDLETDILPWFVSEIARLEVKNKGVSDALRKIHVGLVAKIKPAPVAVPGPITP